MTAPTERGRAGSAEVITRRRSPPGGSVSSPAARAPRSLAAACATCTVGGSCSRAILGKPLLEAHFKALLATGEPLPQRDIEDVYAAAWQRKIDDAAIEIDWGDDSPAHIKDSGLIALRAYVTELAPAVRPASVQREFSFKLAPDLEWALTGR